MPENHSNPATADWQGAPHVKPSATEREMASGSSHRQALKSTSIIGGSTAIVLLIRMVRTKVLAILLGPSGVGLEGLYYSILELARTVAGLGISGSGVRQIAAATGSGNQQVVALTVTTLRRVAIVIGSLGAIVLFLLRKPICLLTFGDLQHAGEVGALSIVLFCGAVNGGQGALLQGMRRIGDLAMMGIIGAIIATVVSIPLVYWIGQRGIIIYIVVGAALGELVAWLYARRIQVKAAGITLRQILQEASALIKLGVILMSSSLMSIGSLYLVRVFVTHQDGVSGVGQFQAANTLSMLYIGFILQAMGTDFYPRLSAAATDHPTCNRLANEQVEVSLLLALPGILGTLAFAPWVIALLYSARFEIATKILWWQMTGMVLRVLCWPLGMIPVAIGRAKVALWTETVSAAVYLLLAWVGLKYYGLPGTGMAFLGSYIFYWALIYTVVKKISGFTWSGANRWLLVLGLTTASAAMVAHFQLPRIWATVVGGVLTLLVGLFCLKRLVALVGVAKLNEYLARFGIRIPFGSKPS